MNKNVFNYRMFKKLIYILKDALRTMGIFHFYDTI